jgi:hypothetical protein
MPCIATKVHFDTVRQAAEFFMQQPAKQQEVQQQQQQDNEAEAENGEPRVAGVMMH